MKIDQLKRLKWLLTHTAVPGPPADGEYKNASVFLVLFGRLETCLLAIQKADTQGYHWRNQVALPGGHIDKRDPSPLDAAYRELEEELGIGREDIQFIGELGHFQTTSSRRDLHVFVGFWNGNSKLHPDKKEISRVLEIPVSQLLERHVGSGFNSRPIVQLGEDLRYHINKSVIWGVTARIVHYFLELLLEGDKSPLLQI